MRREEEKENWKRMRVGKKNTGMEYIHRVSANHERGGSIYLECEPILLEVGVNTWSVSQSCERRGYIPRV